MNDLQAWDLIVGFISATFVLPIIQQPAWSVRLRAAVTFLYSVVVGLVTAYLAGGFGGVHDLRTAAGSVLLLLITAIGTYKGFAKPLAIAPTIEAATSPGRPGELP